MGALSARSVWTRRYAGPAVVHEEREPTSQRAQVLAVLAHLGETTVVTLHESLAQRWPAWRALAPAVVSARLSDLSESGLAMRPARGRVVVTPEGLHKARQFYLPRPDGEPAQRDPVVARALACADRVGGVDQLEALVSAVLACGIRQTSAGGAR